GTEKFNDALGWTFLVGGDGGYAKVDPFNPNIVYHTFTGISLAKSTNGGTSFTNVSSGISGNANFYAYYTTDTGISGRVLFGGDSLWETLDSGSTWTAIATAG